MCQTVEKQILKKKKKKERFHSHEWPGREIVNQHAMNNHDNKRAQKENENSPENKPKTCKIII